MIIIMNALKYAIQDFYILVSALQAVSDSYAQVARAKLCLNRVQEIKRLSHATCHVPHSRQGQLCYSA